jgi:hypothetical protein
MFVGVAHALHENQLATGTAIPLSFTSVTVTALLPTFCIANAVVEAVPLGATQDWMFVTLTCSDCVLVENILPPKKITPAPRTTDAMRIIRVVITFPIPLRFWNLNSILVGKR